MEKILIIGGSSGMGLATAKFALNKNYEVIIASRSAEKLATAAKTITHPNLRTHVVDTRDEASIQKLFDDLGRIDHLVLSGSEVNFGDIRTSTVASVKESFDSKFFGPLRTIQRALDYLSAHGSITLFSGTAGTKPEKGTEILSAINGAVDSFAHALAKSLAPIRVNSIAPGIIDTPVYDSIDANTRAMFQQFTESLLVKRMGTAQEVAQAVLYLIENKYVTGTTLYVDGGHVV